MPKPLSEATAPAKKKRRRSVNVNMTDRQQVAKDKFASERSTKGWYVNGVFVKAWVSGMWKSMSDAEQHEYRNGREQGGNWPEQTPEHLQCNPGTKQRLLTTTVSNLFFSEMLEASENIFESQVARHTARSAPP